MATGPIRNSLAQMTALTPTQAALGAANDADVLPRFYANGGRYIKVKLNGKKQIYY